MCLNLDHGSHPTTHVTAQPREEGTPIWEQEGAAGENREENLNPKLLMKPLYFETTASNLDSATSSISLGRAQENA